MDFSNARTEALVSHQVEPRELPRAAQRLPRAWDQSGSGPACGEPRLARRLVVSRKLRCGAQKRRLWGQHAFAILEDLRFRVPCNRWVQSSSQRPQRNSSAAHLPSDVCSRTQWPLSTHPHFQAFWKAICIPCYTLPCISVHVSHTERGKKTSHLS